MSYTMPYGVWEDPSCQKPVAQQPFTPMENIGDDYLNAGWLAYPTPQSGVFQGCTTQSQSSNHSSPTLYAPQPHAWSMLPLNTAYSTSSSPTDCRTDSVQRQAEAWATMSNASFTPALEKSRFDFDFDTALQPFTASGPYGQHYDSYACVDPTNIHAASYAMHNSTYGGSSYGPMHSQGSFSQTSKQLQQSRGHSPVTQPSLSPLSSNKSATSVRSKNTCPYPDCGKSYKDLAAHLLTHNSVRPFKCSQVSCDFYTRGFSRKYDRDRHIVTTHHKSTMICGFCHGAGQKTFQRTDVFKRHLVSVHCQGGSSKGKKSPMSTTSPSVPTPAGLCSTCKNVFASPQALLTHLDECVLRAIQEPSVISINNERILSCMGDDRSSYGVDNEDSSFEGSVHGEERNGHNPRSGKGTISTKSSSSSSPLLRSHNVVEGRVTKRTNTLLAPQPLKRKAYPAAWSLPEDEVNLKKRITAVFDGQQRLYKDEMTMNTDYEVDMDLVTMQQAEFLVTSSEEERMRWLGVPSYS